MRFMILYDRHHRVSPHYVTVLYELQNSLLLMKRKAIEMFTFKLVMLRHSAPYCRPALRYMGPSAPQTTKAFKIKARGMN